MMKNITESTMQPLAFELPQNPVSTSPLNSTQSQLSLHPSPSSETKKDVRSEVFRLMSTLPPSINNHSLSSPSPANETKMTSRVMKRCRATFQSRSPPPSPYAGTQEKKRYSYPDATIKLYPQEERSLSIHPLSESNLLDALCRSNNDVASKNQFLRQYRGHNRTTSFHPPTTDVILIIVNFHFSHYGSVPFLDSAFFPEFARLYPVDFDVVYIGSDCHRSMRILKNGYMFKGLYSYHSFRIVYELFSPSQYPYKGYLFMNDDSYVDPQFLSSYNLSGSWVEPSVVYNGYTRWWWNTQRNVRKVSNSEAFYNAMDEIASDRAINERCSFASPGALRKGYSDFFYVYREDAPFFMMMEEVMFHHRVFLEFAVPTILQCLNAQLFVDCNHDYMENRTRCVHVHPVKLSSPYSRAYVMKRLKHENMFEVPVCKY